MKSNSSITAFSNDIGNSGQYGGIATSLLDAIPSARRRTNIAIEAREREMPCAGRIVECIGQRASSAGAIGGFTYVREKSINEKFPRIE